jgi:TRAP-type C4-dicarboxylate transport system permease small subunit
MTFLRSVLSSRGKVILDMICFAVGFSVLHWVDVYNIQFFLDSVSSGSRSMQVSETPLAIPQVFLPLGAVIMLLQFLAESLKSYYA